MVRIKVKSKSYALHLSSRRIEELEMLMGVDIGTCITEHVMSTKFFRHLLECALKDKHPDFDIDMYVFIDNMQSEGYDMQKKAELIMELLADSGFMKLPATTEEQTQNVI